jgi:hypothetical protein
MDYRTKYRIRAESALEFVYQDSRARGDDKALIGPGLSPQ